MDGLESNSREGCKSTTESWKQEVPHCITSVMLHENQEERRERYTKQIGREGTCAILMESN